MGSDPIPLMSLTPGDGLACLAVRGTIQLMKNHIEIKLLPGKDTPIRAGHPWVFSNAVAKGADAEPGTVVSVKSTAGDALGLGTWNANTSIRVRILTRDPEVEIDAAFFEERLAVLDEWKREHVPAKTDGYRICHAEADGIPGLIVDRYADTIVFQLHTAGMDRLRQEIVDGIKSALKPKIIVERSDLDVRKMEGLHDMPVTIHLGKMDKPTVFKESGLKFYTDAVKGQKTGFFLDQRDARLAIGEISKGKRVLNLFGYSGAFSVHAAKGGAKFVSTVDISRTALELAQQNFTLNGLDAEDEKKYEFLEADVMDILADAKFQKQYSGSDIVICDPPAFAKSERQVEQAMKAYTDLNAACLRLLKTGGILVTSSCSGRVTPDDFRSMLKFAAGRAQKDVRVLKWLGHAADHAERLAFPEGRYLKTAILEVI